MNICICGGGSLSHVITGFLGSQSENKLFVLTRKPQLWSSEIVVTDFEGREYVAKDVTVTSNPAESVSRADIVLLCLPGFAIRDELEKIKSSLNPHTLVGSVVSSTGFFFQAFDILDNKQLLFGFQRVPFIARTSEYGHRANLKGYKSSLNVAIENVTAEQKEDFRSQLECLFKIPVSLLTSYYEASLTNSNPLLHTSSLSTR